MNKIKTTIAIALLFATTTALATPITASVNCSSDTSCIATPDSGSVLLDPTMFELMVDWSPQHIELIEPPDDRLEVNVTLLFDVTGSVSDVFETIAADALTLTEMGGVAIPGLNENYDDVTSFNPTLAINFDIFGPDTQSSFFVHGFRLANSSLVPLVGTFDSFAFREARFSVGSGSAEIGVWAVPEPGTLSLLGLGLFGLGFIGSRKRISSSRF